MSQANRKSYKRKISETRKSRRARCASLFCTHFGSLESSILVQSSFADAMYGFQTDSMLFHESCFICGRIAMPVDISFDYVLTLG